MSSIRKIQSFGIATKAVTLVLGVAQTVIILRILSPTQYGLIGIVTALASLVGVSQNVGVVDATIREIAITDDKRRRAHIFWVSLWFRMIFTLPISLALIFFAPLISNNFYKIPELTNYIYIMSFVLVLQGIQGVLGGIYTGLRAFKLLYLFQILTSVINVFVFALMCLRFGVNGFFAAMVTTTSIFILLLAFFLRSTLGSLSYPTRSEFRFVWKDIFHTGFWTYLARIFSVAWQQAPMLLLGKLATPEIVGLYNVALSFATKLTVLAAAISEVNLSFLSHAFGRSLVEFRTMARKTLNEVGAVLSLGASFMALFADYILRIFAGEQYLPALQVAVLVVWAYASFSFLEIGSNTVFVPAKKSQLRALCFASLVSASFFAIIFVKISPLEATGWGILAGGIIALAVGEVTARKFADIGFLSRDLLVVLLCSFASLVTALIYPGLIVRVVVFVLTSMVIFAKVLLPTLRKNKRPIQG